MSAATLPIKTLLQCHPDYKLEKMRQCEAFYEGGDKFEKIKDSLLYKNGDSKTKAVEKQRDERLGCAYYTPHPAGLIEFFLSCLFQVKPSLLVKDGPKSEMDFWNGLSDDAGKGHPIAVEIREATKDAYLYDRGYLMWSIMPPAKEYPNKPEQKAAGGLDAVQITALCATGVDHWKKNEDGSLAWVRCHATEYVQPSPFDQITKQRDTWTFITEKEMTVYAAEREIINGEPRKWNEEVDTVSRVGEDKPHDYGVCPVVEICDICVMSKLLRPAIALFNNEAALQYAVNKSAFSWLCFFTQLAASDIFLGEMAALKLAPGDRVEVKGPDPASIPALERQCDRSKDNLYSTLQSLALQAPSKDAGDRQSGVAKNIDRASIFSLLCAQAEKLLNRVNKLLNALKTVRGDTVTLTIAGLDSFDIDSKEKKLFVAESFLAIPGIPETARKWVIESLALAVCQTAPAAIREQIKTEIEESEKPEPTPAPVPIVQPQTEPAEVDA